MCLQPGQGLETHVVASDVTRTDENTPAEPSYPARRRSNGTS
jgi:hypothetical protein